MATWLRREEKKREGKARREGLVQLPPASARALHFELPQSKAPPTAPEAPKRLRLEAHREGVGMYTLGVLRGFRAVQGSDGSNCS